MDAVEDIKETISKLVKAYEDERDSSDVLSMIERQARLFGAKAMIEKAVTEDPFYLGFSKESGGLSKSGKHLMKQISVEEYDRRISSDEGFIKGNILIGKGVRLTILYKRHPSIVCNCSAPKGGCKEHVDITYDICWSRSWIRMGEPLGLVNLRVTCCGFHSFPSFEPMEPSAEVTSEEDDEKICCTVCKREIKYDLRINHEEIALFAQAIRSALPEEFFETFEGPEEMSTDSDASMSGEEEEDSSEEESQDGGGEENENSESPSNSDEEDDDEEDNMSLDPVMKMMVRWPFIMPTLQMIIAFPFYEQEFDPFCFIAKLVFGDDEEYDSEMEEDFENDM